MMMMMMMMMMMVVVVVMMMMTTTTTMMMMMGENKDTITIKKKNLKWFGHITRRTSLGNIIAHGAVDSARMPGRPSSGQANHYGIA